MRTFFAQCKLLSTYGIVSMNIRCGFFVCLFECSFLSICLMDQCCYFLYRRENQAWGFFPEHIFIIHQLHYNFLHFSGFFFTATASQLPVLDPNYFKLATNSVYLTTVVVTLLKPELFYFRSHCVFTILALKSLFYAQYIFEGRQFESLKMQKIIQWKRGRCIQARSFSLQFFNRDSDSLEQSFHHFLLPREIHFQKEFYEANLPFIPPNIII